MNERFSSEVARAEVSECRHFLTEKEKTLFGADRAGTPFWTTDCAEKDGIGSFGLCEGFLGEGGAVGVD